MNPNVNDTDHPLIIKVASIPSARIQVYFIDNDTYFKRKAVLEDADGNFFADNDERSLFFVRGVLETVASLLGARHHSLQRLDDQLVPLYPAHVFVDEPYFEKAKVIYHAFDEGFEGTLDVGMAAKAEAHGIPADAGLPRRARLRTSTPSACRERMRSSSDRKTSRPTRKPAAGLTSPSCPLAAEKALCRKSTPSTTRCLRKLRLSRSKRSSC